MVGGFVEFGKGMGVVGSGSFLHGEGFLPLRIDRLIFLIDEYVMGKVVVVPCSHV